MDPSQSISRGRSGFARTVGTPVAGMASSFLEEVSISDFTSDARVITEAAPPYRIVHVNAAWCTTTGYPSSAFIGNTCKLLQGSETCKRTTQVLSESLKAFRAITVRLLNYKADRTPFINDLTVMPITDRAARCRRISWASCASDRSRRRRRSRRWSRRRWRR